MKSIVRRDTGEDWKAYLKRLMQEAGVIEEGEEPTVEEIARFDRKRKDKKVSNKEWRSETDADEADSETIGPTIREAQDHLIAADSEANLQEAVADKGYHKNETLAELEFTDGLRTYVAEPKQTHRRNWKDKPDEQRQAVANNRRRIRGKRGRALQRQRSEKVERSFAHVCGTGGSRRTWLMGIDKVRKRYLMSAMAHNLGIVMRKLFGTGTARSQQAEGGLAAALYFALLNVVGLPRRLRPMRNRFSRFLLNQPTAAPVLAPAT
jgi:hypothetical protein